MGLKQKAEELHSQFENAGPLLGQESCFWFDVNGDDNVFVSLDTDFGIVLTADYRFFNFRSALMLNESYKIAPIVKKLKEMFEIYG